MSASGSQARQAFASKNHFDRISGPANMWLFVPRRKTTRKTKRVLNVMVRIRLARHGSKKGPFYHITVADQRRSRNGRFIERVGYFNPVAKGNAQEYFIEMDRVDYWLSKGAQPSDMVKKLVSRAKKETLEVLETEQLAAES